MVFPDASHGGGVNRRYDDVAIGAGPAGGAAAALAGNLSCSVGLVERDTVDGTVVTNGGAPAKTFREAGVLPGMRLPSAAYRISAARRQP
jgi:pyruvate/2-oxoglutarate dehydrogenase complex dihydrolipoamide dehydrogenase (E3) component